MARSVVISSAYSELLTDARKFLAGTEVVILGATKAAADEFARSLCNGGLLGVHAMTLTQLAASIAGPAMGEADLAALTKLGAEAVAARVTHAAIQNKKLGYFEPVATTPGFARAVACTLTELRLQRISLSGAAREALKAIEEEGK